MRFLGRACLGVSIQACFDGTKQSLRLQVDLDLYLSPFLPPLPLVSLGNPLVLDGVA